MGNINTLNEAVKFLYTETYNEFVTHSNLQTHEAQSIAKTIVEIFAKLDKEVNGYDEVQVED